MRRFKKTFIFLTITLTIAALSGFLWIYLLAKDLPSFETLNSRKVSESTKIYDRTGKTVLFEIYGEEKRTIIPFSKISKTIINATLAAEDASFYEHSAFDLKSIIRAIIADIANKSLAQGGSTITQQLAKTAFLNPEKTLTRKIKELLLSIELEKRYSKDRILEFYLNQIPYGNNTYGIEAASSLYFGKSTSDLDIAESALLAGIPKAPTFYSPWGSNIESLTARKNYILERMFSEGWITEEEKESSAKEDLKFLKPAQNIIAPHFVIMVRDYLNKEYGEDFVRTSGLKVITTLDLDLQKIAEKSIEDGAKINSELYNGKNAALVAEDPKTGQILALVGSRDYFDIESEGNFNVASQGLRQPGSALKPIIYATAFKKGYVPETVFFDTETEFDTTGDPENSYKPSNYDGNFRGPIDIRHSLSQSINIPAVKALYLVGLDEALKTANDFGLDTLTERGRYGLSLVLGGGEVRLIDLVGAYSVFAEDGIKNDQSLILEISNKNGVLEKYRETKKSVIDPLYAEMIDDILSDSEARRPIFGGSLDIQSLSDYQIAVKTGTSNDYRDAWTVGYTPNLVVGVWAGNNDNSPMTKEGASIKAAVPIWKSFLSEALPKFNIETFNKPTYDLPEKPILRGQATTNFESSGITYPQIHDILFYIDKSNPLGPIPESPENDIQFKNWEEPVLAWAVKNLPNWIDFNKPLPIDAVLSEIQNSESNKTSISIIEPKNGDIVSENSVFTLNANISSSLNIRKIELFLNDFKIDELLNGQVINISRGTSYQRLIKPISLNHQNMLKIVTTDDAGNKEEKSLILFKRF